MFQNNSANEWSDKRTSASEEAPPENLHSLFLSQRFQLRMGLKPRIWACPLWCCAFINRVVAYCLRFWQHYRVCKYFSCWFTTFWATFKLCCCTLNMHIRKCCSPHMFAGARDRGEAVCCYSNRKGAPSGKPSEPTFTLSFGPFWEKIVRRRPTGCVPTLSVCLCANTQSLNQQNTVVISYHQPLMAVRSLQECNVNKN